MYRKDAEVGWRSKTSHGNRSEAAFFADQPAIQVRSDVIVRIEVFIHVISSLTLTEVGVDSRLF
jgi:hypothetical protein